MGPIGNSTAGAGDGEDGGFEGRRDCFAFSGVGMYGESSEMEGEGISSPVGVYTCRSRRYALCGDRLVRSSSSYLASSALSAAAA